MNPRRKPIAAVLAVCAMLVLSVTAFASGGKALEHVFRMMSGPLLQQGVDEDGNLYFEGSDAEPVSPVERREDGRLYLTINGENLDITEQCSYETPYIYTCTGEDRLEHIFIIGGEPEAPGWVEYTVGTEGTEEDVAVGGMVVAIPDETEPQNLPWLQKGLEQIGNGVQIELIPYQASSQEEGTMVEVLDENGDVIGGTSQVTTVTVMQNQE